MKRSALKRGKPLKAKKPLHNMLGCRCEKCWPKWDKMVRDWRRPYKSRHVDGTCIDCLIQFAWYAMRRVK